MYNLAITPPSWVALGFPDRQWFKVDEINTSLAEEVILQESLCKSILSTSSHGASTMPLTRSGICTCTDASIFSVSLEEIKHPASNIWMTFPWKQMWWIITSSTFNDTTPRHAIQLQHGFKSGFRRLYYDTELIDSAVTVLWDSGHKVSFTRDGVVYTIKITLEGSFFSTHLQYYSYALTINDTKILPFFEE